MKQKSALVFYQFPGFTPVYKIKVPKTHNTLYITATVLGIHCTIIVAIN